MVQVNKEQYMKEYVENYLENPTEENKSILWEALYNASLHLIRKRPFFQPDEVPDVAMDMTLFAMKRISKGKSMTNVYGYLTLALTNILYNEAAKQESREVVSYEDYMENILKEESYLEDD